MCKLSVQLFLFSIALLSIVAVPHATAQIQIEPSPDGTEQEEPEVYSESALRRFEIITLSSLPFTAIHSYAIMRGVKMFRENQFAPELTRGTIVLLASVLSRYLCSLVYGIGCIPAMLIGRRHGCQNHKHPHPLKMRNPWRGHSRDCLKRVRIQRDIEVGLWKTR